MKMRALRIAVIATVLFFSFQTWAQNASSPIQIALLRYQVNTVTSVVATFTAVPAGTAPVGVAFDGFDIWLANATVTSGNVTRLRASDGACVGTCTFAVGNDPVFVAFDGVYIWVANPTPSSVTKLRASDGTNFGTFQLGPTSNTSVAVGFDGGNVWVTDGPTPRGGLFKL